MNRRPQALLLLGPTASGKTPLGDRLESDGLGGRPCVHFDFGAHLRATAEMTPAAGGLSAVEHAVVERVLREGTLLEDCEFPIAAKLLAGFLRRREVGPDHLVVLNGMPRHAGQATAVESIVEVTAVVELVCSADVALARIEADTGGDRAGRADDAAAAVRERIRLYHERTEPLVVHYCGRGARIIRLEIGEDTTAVEAAQALAEAW